MPTELLIVRHGQSTWNALGRWQGHADPPLSDLGRRQAIGASSKLLTPFDLYVASDLTRASHTAELLAADAAVRAGDGDPGLVETDAAFRERSAGEWEGLTRTDLDERWPNWQDHEWRPDGFETDVDVLARVLPALANLVEKMSAAGQTTVLIVTHGGVVRALDRHFEVEPVMVPNLAGRWFHHNKDLSAGDVVSLATHITDSDVE